MTLSIDACKQTFAQIKEYCKQDLGTVRTGKATPQFLDSLMVEAYGSLTPVTQVASVTLEDFQTLKINPWDTSIISAIEKALQAGDFGVGTSNDGRNVRVHFPAMTEETRLKVVKQAKEKLEDARVRVKQEREKIHKQIDADKKTGIMSEDDSRRAKDEVQKLVEASNKDLEELFQLKEKEILQK